MKVSDFLLYFPFIFGFCALKLVFRKKQSLEVPSLLYIDSSLLLFTLVYCSKPSRRRL